MVVELASVRARRQDGDGAEQDCAQRAWGVVDGLRKLITERSEGVLRFHVASLYPLLYRLERRGWVKGEWEPAAGRRRRCYRLTPTGVKILAEQRSRWRAFSGAVNRIVEVRHA